ncbi:MULTISPECIES: DUF262 domain-containing protein [Burkholderia cepacia complex]|uniref:DUF262 domain-containing protein n=1 Tax=Burkholderia stagnalis TaxID=1503054 RepID=A0ABX9YBY1_9BURK|nr:MULTISPECIES: DUF262 domain-containing protein [Burkholderia cepacia complex]KWN17716.1 hypothetical protein WM21_08860 [Burkholderia ubonensis]RQQ44293.1 DUF262 domain-containing protein [Burkholderia stagnalis]RQQ58049.1 DUF262 domain-containing protein [Burkholderia stagnalis]RQQ58237.1 DUF262 domain-containing protein [Burkholderia stagnalis]RQQ71742.1 DUF262 domain-containing protein [Burkholderia stagnalis]
MNADTQKNADSQDDELQTIEEQDEAEPFVTYDIASYPSDLTLAGIRDMWDQGDIVIPDFQRNYVWNVKQASLLIESFLLGLPVPQVFFYLGEDNKSLVIDGQQRIMSVIYFFEGYFGDESTQSKRQVFRLTGLDERSQFANKKYDELDDAAQRKLRQSVLRAINIRQLTPKNENTSIYHIFERLNTGGTPLKAQEIRNCVFRGEISAKLKALNLDKNWRNILGKPKLDKHQKDVELILRVFSLAQSHWRKYEKPMKEFLNVAMNGERAGNSKRVINFVEAFPKAAKIIVEKLGQKPFHIRGPLNASALDAVMAIVIDNIDKVPDDIKVRYDRLIADKRFSDATFYGTSDVSVLHARFNAAQEILIG